MRNHEREFARIICEGTRSGKIENLPWQKQCMVDNFGQPLPVEIFAVVDEYLYINMLICDTVDQVDDIIERMMNQ